MKVIDVPDYEREFFGDKHMVDELLRAIEQTSSFPRYVDNFFKVAGGDGGPKGLTDKQRAKRRTKNKQAKKARARNRKK